MKKKLISLLNQIFAPRVTYYYNDKGVDSNHPAMKRAKEGFKRMNEAFEKMSEAFKMFDN